MSILLKLYHLKLRPALHGKYNICYTLKLTVLVYKLNLRSTLFLDVSKITELDCFFKVYSFRKQYLIKKVKNYIKHTHKFQKHSATHKNVFSILVLVLNTITFLQKLHSDITVQNKKFL